MASRTCSFQIARQPPEGRSPVRFEHDVRRQDAAGKTQRVDLSAAGLSKDFIDPTAARVDDRVVAGAAGEPVVAHSAVEDVVPGIAPAAGRRQDRPPYCAECRCRCRRTGCRFLATIELVVAVVADEHVTASATFEHLRAAVAAQSVVAAQSPEHVTTRAAYQRVVTFRAGRHEGARKNE